MKTSKLKALLAFAFIGLAVVGTASATTVNCPVTDDAMIMANSAGSGSAYASGRGPGMFAGADGNGSMKRSLVKFDLSGISGTPTITAVELDLVIGQIAGSAGMGPGCGMTCNPASRTFDVYVVDPTNTWTEGQTGATACVGFTTLCSSINGTGQGYPYTTAAGCLGAGSGASCGGDVTWEYYNYTTSGLLWGNGPTNQDFGSGSFGSPSFGNHTAVGSWTFNNFLNNATMPFTANTSTNNPGFTAAVQAWINGTVGNNGFEIRGPALESVRTSFIGWWTKDGAIANSNSALSPVLKVTY